MLTRKTLQAIINQTQLNHNLIILETELRNNDGSPVYRLTIQQAGIIIIRLGIITTTNTTITYSQFEDIDHHYQLADPHFITKLANDIKTTINRRTPTCSPEKT